MRPFRQGFFCFLGAFLLLFSTFFSGCRKQAKTTANAPGKSERETILFTSYPASTVRPLLADFVQRYGVNVRIVSECADDGRRRMDLVARLILHARNRPAGKKAEADVFWGDEPTRAILLKRHGAAAPYLSPRILDVPTNFRDPAGYWVGFAARPSFTLFNRLQLRAEQASAFPQATKNVVPVVTAPLNGAAAATALAYAARHGFVELQTYYYSLKNAGTVFYTDENQTRSALVGGSANWGILSGEQCVAALSEAYFLSSISTEDLLLIPDVAVLVSEAPNAFDAQKLIDYLAGPEFAAGLTRQLLENKRQLEGKTIKSKEESKNEEDGKKNKFLAIHPARIFFLKETANPEPNVFAARSFKTLSVDWEKAAEYRTAFENFLVDKIFR